jgi:predicted nucleotidyltransferase
MAQIPDQINQIIKKYIAALYARQIPIQHVFLFGSYAKGNYTEWSDIDLVVVSEIFEGSRFEDHKKIRPITLSGSSLIEVLPYRPEDFTPEDPFVREILKTGIQIV